jgi:hypothetical protein
MLKIPQGIPIRGFVYNEGKVLLLANYHEYLVEDSTSRLDVEGSIVTNLTLGRGGLHLGYSIQVPPSVKTNLGFTFLCTYKEPVNELSNFRLRHRLENMRIFSADGYVLFISEYPNKIRNRLEAE